MKQAHTQQDIARLELPISVGEFASKLLGWYRENKRDLPWRNDPDPYRVWVSEVMLQQTQVKTVFPYFTKFLETYPSLEALARAEENQVLSNWSGLGYYNRARNLRRAAQIVCEQHEGTFPRDYRDALQLPGIGRYTAGAILSIAYQEPLPIVDGNIQRLFARYLKIEREPEREITESLWQLLSGMVKDPAVTKNVSEFNQALMEMGALICIPRNPRCSSCPLAVSCVALKQGLQSSLPLPRRRKGIRQLHYTVAIIVRGGRYLLRKNLSRRLLAGFWEFPRVLGRPSEQSPRNFRRLHRLDLEVEQEVETVTHQITFRRMHFHPLLVSLRGSVPKKNFTWTGLANNNYPIPSYVKKIAGILK